MFVGYKCFDKGLINRYGTKFEVNKLYHCDGKVKFGNDGNGFHVCKRLEDTLRYFDAMSKDVDIALVICNGDYKYYEDERNEFYDMYVFEYLFIEKILTREEIINYGLNLYGECATRFISLFKLTSEEIPLFKQKYAADRSVLNAIAYYQGGDKEVYNNYYRLTKK